MPVEQSHRSKLLGYLFFSFWLAAGSIGMAQDDEESKAGTRPFSLTLTTKLHSTGHSPYSGVYINRHLNGELNLQFVRRHFGAFLSKSFDFTDRRSGINFATVGIYRSVPLSRSFKFIPYIGYFLQQRRSLIDEGSDMWAAAEFQWDVTDRFMVKNTMLFGGLARRENSVSLSNRVNTRAALGEFKLDLYVWYSHEFDRSPHFVSASLAVTSPDWILTNTLLVRVQLAALQQISKQRPENAMTRGMLVSAIVPLELGKCQ
jgi:hypothetical protein